ncbi:Transmembrane transcriptional regulator (anti-sigma factor RsiW) [Actinopolyspora xinjiangensis]|uniref:Transmembrane transcriptional regulator (Anti-sigma factor RsiW) n=1 Tax=Actinopolyspora xinjiangensis TaxID=405564 RepID=A0A1H0NTV7_9ACTN|nr:zf-HC2 domain-containing protein [Actinopolyspora xinjiangensis]SDO96182.1 Transmembrane transcriptional regulator (anti-sigma factor RsiW) [Actinopolyspora xinjiangensis]
MTYANDHGRVGMNWHIPEEQLHAYVSGEIGSPEAWSVESHLVECARCADRVAGAVEHTELAPRVENVRGRVLDHISAETLPRTSREPRTPIHWPRVRRLLTAAPALRLPWLVAAVLVVACAAALSLLSGGAEQAGSVLLLNAPLLPLAGVALSYGPGMDPAYELTLATPYSGLRLLLLRTVSVLAVTVPLLLGTSFVFPTGGISAAAWLLPCLALVLVTLLLGSWIEHRLAAVLVGAAWSAAVLVPRFLLVIDVSRVFDPMFQLTWAGVVVVSAVMLIGRRSAYDRMGS